MAVPAQVTLKINLPRRAHEILRVKVPDIPVLPVRKGGDYRTAVPGFYFYGAFDDGKPLISNATRLVLEGYIPKAFKSPRWMRKEDSKTGRYFLYRRRRKPDEVGGGGWGAYE
jgi:hypothetical protein